LGLLTAPEGDEMTFTPCTDLPAYATWTHDQLVAAATNYHNQLVQMHQTIQALRLELKELK
jgi:hypothetical protein